MELTDIQTIKNLAKQFDFVFSKGLGQNFLTDSTVLDEIADAAEIEYGVLEVGPGFGVLTKALAERAEKVVSIEIDQRLLEVLDQTVGMYQHVKIVHADIMKLDLKRLIQDEFAGKAVSVAANLPYYITTPILAKLIESRLPVKNIVVMVQKEVAERICAEPGKKEYGAISVMCQYYTKPSIVVTVPASSFIPQPKVDSAVLKLEVCAVPNIAVKDEKMFFRVVKAAFAQRRKTLLNCLSHAFPIPKEEISQLLERAEIQPSVRGEKLGLAEFARIADLLGDTGV